MAYVITQRGAVLAAGDAAATDLYGVSVAISRDGLVMAIGATGRASGGTSRGGVYLYDRNGSGWTQRGSVLTAGDAADSDQFGSGVALSSDGAVLIVGASSWEGASGTDRGGVYIFDRNGSGWTQRGSVLTAGDAADSDQFGFSVTLSDDGLVLAVGAFAWEGASGTDRGGVYIFDRNGSGWTQRGSVLTAGDAADYDYFGFALGFNTDGNVLVVGAILREGASGTDRGGVYLFDRNGSGWTQRGSVLEASDAADTDQFGIALALNANASILAVGASQWEGASGSDRGAVYLYDISGSTFTQNGNVIEAPDGADKDRFGRAVALTTYGDVLAVGAARWEGANTDQGGVYVFDVAGVPAFGQSSGAAAVTAAGGSTASVAGDAAGSGGAQGDGGSIASAEGNAAGAGTLDAISDVIIIVSADGGAAGASDAQGAGAWVLAADGTADGTAQVLAEGAALTSTAGDSTGSADVQAAGSFAWIPQIALELTVAARGWNAALFLELSTTRSSTPELGLELEVVRGVFAPQLPLELTTSRSVTPELPLVLAVAATMQMNQWGAAVRLNGADVSHRLTGELVIEAEEGAARLADFTLKPDAGVVNLLSWVGAAVEIDIGPAGAEVFRRFTGLVDVPTYDPATKLTHFSCTDNLQTKVAAMPDADLLALTGALDSTILRGTPKDRWQLAQSWMRQVAGSLDLSPYGAPRVTLWDNAGANYSFTAPDVVDETVSLSLAERSTLVNRVNVELEYRYPLLKKRGYGFDWAYSIDNPWPNYGYPLYAEPFPPYMQYVVDAAAGSGWEIEYGSLSGLNGATFSVQKVSDGYGVSGAQLGLAWEMVRDNLTGLSVDELQAPAAPCYSAGFFLSKRFSQTITEAWALTVESPESIAQVGVLETTESASAQATFDVGAWEKDESAEPVLAVSVANLEAQYAIVDADVTRYDADAALNALVQIGRTAILASHRNNRCNFSLPLHPMLDVRHRVAVNCQGIAATGKVFKLIDRMSFDTGSAITEINLALSGTGATGLPAPEQIVTLPPPPETPTEASPEPLQISYGTHVGGHARATPFDESWYGWNINIPDRFTVCGSAGLGQAPDECIELINPLFTGQNMIPNAHLGFKIHVPAIESGSRDPADLPVTGTHTVAVPVDSFSITV